MAYSEALAERIRQRLARREKRGCLAGSAFLLNANMCVGVWKDSLIARVGQDQYEAALREPFVGKFDITGRAMKGWILIAPDGIEGADQLQQWIQRAVKFVEMLAVKWRLGSGEDESVAKLPFVIGDHPVGAASPAAQPSHKATSRMQEGSTCAL